ncbi:hypothetical protein T439DRAFT_336608 [Meredithblackwellia eburnea MCA 4105]
MRKYLQSADISSGTLSPNFDSLCIQSIAGVVALVILSGTGLVGAAISKAYSRDAQVTPGLSLASVESAAVPDNETTLRATSTSFGVSTAFGHNKTSTSSSPTLSLGSKVVKTAEKYLGVKYVWGGTDPEKGLDCSGLTQLCFKENKIKIPRVSQDQAKVGKLILTLKKAQVGDLLFFGGGNGNYKDVHHVALFIGGNRLRHAPHTGSVVRDQTIWEEPSYIRRIEKQEDV